jgi:hypothetical protein
VTLIAMQRGACFCCRFEVQKMRLQRGRKDRKSCLLPPTQITFIVVVMSTEHYDNGDKFLKRMLAFENGPFTTNFDQLIKVGVELPAPETADDAQLHRTLWNVIWGWPMPRLYRPHGPLE